MLLDFTKASYSLYCQKRVAILKKKMKKLPVFEIRLSNLLARKLQN